MRHLTHRGLEDGSGFFADLARPVLEFPAGGRGELAWPQSGLPLDAGFFARAVYPTTLRIVSLDVV